MSVMIKAVEFSQDETKPVLVLGPSLGTSAQALYGTIAARLTPHFRVIAWDLPGHGHCPAHSDEFTMAQLAEGVQDAVDRAVGDEPFFYGGDSVGGAVGLQLMLDAPQRVLGAVLMCTAATFPTPQSWAERAATVRQSGTPALVEGSAKRWFGEGFIERHPERATPLLHALQNADAQGYAQVCGALAGFDVRERLGEIFVPVTTIAGVQDTATPPSALAQIADGVRDGRSEVLDGVAHLAPIEAPEEVARIFIRDLVGSLAKGETEHSDSGERTLDEVHAAGMTVRRAVLGDDHVDRAVANTTDFTRDFQSMITRYAWGGIWDRPGLDRRSRSLITLTAMVALGHHDEFAMHVRAARRNGLTNDEIKEVLLQCAVYCGVPAANTAFKIAQAVLDEVDGEAADGSMK